MMDKGDVVGALMITGFIAGGIGVIAAIVYVIVSVAKFAWES